MELTKGLIAILLTAILTQNFVLSKFLGICPFLGVSKKLNTAVGMSAAVIFVMALATAATVLVRPIRWQLVSSAGKLTTRLVRRRLNASFAAKLRFSQIGASCTVLLVLEEEDAVFFSFMAHASPFFLSP